MRFQLYVRLGVCLAALPGLVMSQEGRPKFQITAEVTDASGAVVVGATVQFQEISTPMKVDGTTNENGNFRIPLEAGKYNVSISVLAFKLLTQQIEVKSVGDQRFMFVLSPTSVVICGPCQVVAMPQTEMSKLPDQLVLPPSPVPAPIKLSAPRKSPIARFFSAIGHQLGV